MMDWPLADAKNRFSEVVTKALTVGPQRVRRRGRAVIILDEVEYQRLLGERPTFKAHLFEGPRIDDLDLRRDDSAGRDLAW